MRTWVIGDIHGCHHTLLALWERMALGPKDRVYVLGDTVGKGRYSFEVLRHLYRHNSTCLMGNHELFWLDEGQLSGSCHDAAELRHWVTSWPWILYLEAYDALLVHAGLPSDMDVRTLLAHGASLTARAHDPLFINNVRKYDAQDPLSQCAWSFTHVRYFDPMGQPASCIYPPPQPDLTPWYDRCLLDCTVYFGHWAYLSGQSGHPRRIALDGGAVYGQHLLAYELGSQTLLKQACDMRDLL